MDIGQAQRQLTSDLTPLYDSREAGLIADWVMEHLTGRSKLDRLMRPAEVLADPLLRKYYIYRSELLAHRPVQYVIHETWFAGLRFYVDETVLIPRPETEELVEWALATIPAVSSDPLLDVGTGSGCVAVTIARRLQTLPVHACDISTSALKVMEKNAAHHGASIAVHHLDFLDRGAWATLPRVKWLISNPPYIPAGERSTLAPHVANAEPAIALFVPDSDPFVFYQAIGEFARQRLLPGGSVWVEIHENLAAGVVEVFRSAGAVEVETRKDRMGKDRMIKGGW
jgi:release factor glutamine methyltransferase